MASPQEFALTVLASAGASAVLSGVGVWLAREWISERLRRSIQHEYDQKLASLNAQLRAETDKQAALLKASIERESDRLRYATSTISLTHKAAIERRLAGIEALWQAVLNARANVPPVIGFIGKINWLQRVYEQKILAAMQLILSGEQFGETALKQAYRMEEQMRQLKPVGSDA